MRVCRAVTAFLITVKGVSEDFYFFLYWCVGKSLWVASSVGSLDTLFFVFDKGEGRDGRCDVVCGACFCFVKKVYDVEDERREEKRREEEKREIWKMKGRRGGSFKAC